nr:hypothetical protein [Tanacetum cinerariifolium]
MCSIIPRPRQRKFNDSQLRGKERMSKMLSSDAAYSNGDVDIVSKQMVTYLQKMCDRKTKSVFIEEKKCFRQRKDNVFVEEEEYFVEEKQCFRRREKNASVEEKECSVEEKECFRQREKNVFVEEKECFVEENEYFVKEKECFRRREKNVIVEEKMMFS